MPACSPICLTSWRMASASGVGMQTMDELQAAELVDERLGLLEVVLRGAGVRVEVRGVGGEARVARRAHAVVDPLVDDVLVDGVGHRLAGPHVVERRLGVVQQEDGGARAADLLGREALVLGLGDGRRSRPSGRCRCRPSPGRRRAGRCPGSARWSACRGTAAGCRCRPSASSRGRPSSTTRSPGVNSVRRERAGADGVVLEVGPPSWRPRWATRCSPLRAGDVVREGRRSAWSGGTRP